MYYNGLKKHFGAHAPPWPMGPNSISCASLSQLVYKPQAIHEPLNDLTNGLWFLCTSLTINTINPIYLHTQHGLPGESPEV